MTFFVYILENTVGRFYIGSTDNLNRRVEQHNDAERGRNTFARKNGPWRLVWSEEHLDRASAMRRERAIKAMKSAAWIREPLLKARGNLDT